ncbi:MAG: plastocyanin/azurin family copper-binding protein [Dokdonella sp.]
MHRILIVLAFGGLAMPALAATFTVEVGPGTVFSPASVTISEGDTVRFVNRGGLHNVKSNDNTFRCAHGCDGDGHGGNGAPSSDIWFALVTFPLAGTIGYYCETHGTPTSGMRGTVIVEAAVPVELESFEID